MTVHVQSVEAFEALLSEKAALVDFYAEWCGPCRMMAPVLEKLADDFAGRAVVAKVNCDEQEALAARFGVMSIPTLIFFKSGVPAETLVGAQPYEVVAEKLERLL